MSDKQSAGKESRAARLMDRIENHYGKEAADRAVYLKTEAAFAVRNDISEEEAVLLINPRLSQAVIRELLLAVLEDVPVEELKPVLAYDIPEVLDVSRVRKQFYEQSLERIRESLAQEEAGDRNSGSMAPQYAETLQKFVSEIRLLVSDQQNANQAVMELMNGKESTEKQELITVIRSQEKEIESLRSNTAEKDERIMSLQDEIQRQIRRMADSNATAGGRQINMPQNPADTSDAASAYEKETRRGLWRRPAKQSKDQERDELFSLLCKPEINEEQLGILLQAFDDGVPIDKIRVISTGKLSASHMRKALRVYGLKERGEGDGN